MKSMRTETKTSTASLEDRREGKSQNAKQKDKEEKKKKERMKELDTQFMRLGIHKKGEREGDHQLFNSRNVPKDESPSSQHDDGWKLTHIKAHYHEKQKTEDKGKFPHISGSTKKRRPENRLQNSPQQLLKRIDDRAVPAKC